MIDTTLTQTLLLLGVTIAILVAFRRLRVPASLGYLLVGVLLGSKTAGPVIPDDVIIIIAEFGIVFLLFSIGLTFSLSQIYALRHTVLVFGLAQVSLTTAVVALLAWCAGLPPVAAFVVGAVCAQSSTTIISKQLLDQGEDSARHGRLGTAMSVFQDITAVPFIVMIPVLGVADPHSIATTLGVALLKAAVAVAVVLLVGRYVLRPLFHLVSQGASFELFTLTVLFVSLAAAWATHSVGLSMAFGAFLAGMVLGETEFRHQVESTIRPFRDVLLGVFFISIGMLLDPSLLPSIWHQALVAALVLLVVKAILVTAIVRVGGLDLQTAIRTGLILAVGGEFGFALLAIGLDSQAIDAQTSQIMLNAVLFSMVSGPLLIRFNQPLARWMCGFWPTSPPLPAESGTPELERVRSSNHVILCGYGRIGQVVGRFLESENISSIAIDIDPGIAREARLAGQSVFFGDSSDVAVLESAGVQEAALLILCHDDLAAALKTLRNARRLNPGLPIVARARDERHVNDLRKAGASEVIPETLEAGVMIVSHALMAMKVPAHRIVQRLQEQRASRYQVLREFFRGAFPDRDAPTLAGTDQLHSVPIAADSPAVGKTIGELEGILERVAITTLARNGRPERSPPRSKRVEAGDVLVLLGSTQDLDRAEARLTGAQPSVH
jgi:CPA2 family monovalent cation:H+ antiporter-2